MNEKQRMIPQNIDAEICVLGGMLSDPDCIDDVLQKLKTEDFYLQRHVILFGTICKLHKSNIPIDQLSLSEELKNIGKLEEVGGYANLNEIESRGISMLNTLHYISIVRDKSFLRKVLKLAQNMAREAYGEAIPSELIHKVSKEFQEICEGRFEKGFMPISDIIPGTYEDIQTAHDKDRPKIGTQTGVAELDEMTTGFSPSDYIVLGGATSSGKTSYAQTIAKNVAFDGKVVGIFSLEMDAKQLVMRFMAMTAGVDSHKMRSGYLSKDERQLLHDIIPQLAATRMYIDDNASHTIESIRIQARLLQRSVGKIDLLIVDYIQLIKGSDSSKFSNREREVSDISHGLKAIARELECPVLALAQLSRKVEARHGEPRPRLSDLRESGSIEQDADGVIFVYRPEYYGIKQIDIGGQSYSSDGIAEIIVAKQRKGPTGSFYMKFRKEHTSFEKLELEYIDIEDEIGDEEPWTGYNN